jgi:hypothetical protein
MVGNEPVHSQTRKIHIGGRPRRASACVKVTDLKISRLGAGSPPRKRVLLGYSKNTKQRKKHSELILQDAQPQLLLFYRLAVRFDLHCLALGFLCWRALDNFTGWQLLVVRSLMMAQPVNTHIPSSFPSRSHSNI